MATVGKPRPIDERRAQFAKYKEDVKKRGKPFYPYAMFHDTVMSLVVVVVIIGLAVIWKWTTPGDHTGTGAGWLGSLYSDPADPGTTSFVPRPDWYFYFLFYLLRIFKWPDSAKKQGFTGNKEALAGAKLFTQAGCATCHTYLGTGSSNLGAPDLSKEGAKGRGLQFQINHLKCPSCVTPGSPMPSFASLGDDNIRKIAIFLEASKGGK